MERSQLYCPLGLEKIREEEVTVKSLQCSLEADIQSATMITLNIAMGVAAIGLVFSLLSFSQEQECELETFSTSIVSHRCR